MSVKKTDHRFTILYCIGTVFVVSGHCLGGSLTFLDNWFPYYSFHLQLFAFASGYFFRDHEDAGKFLGRKAKRLLLPLFLWNIFYGILNEFLFRYLGFDWGGERLSLTSLLISPLISGSQFRFSQCAWYVVPLFLNHVYHFATRRVFEKLPGRFREWILFGLNVLVGMAGVYLAASGIYPNEEWWLLLLRTLFFIPFYGFGILYRRVLEQKDTLPSIPYFTIIFLIQLIIITVYGHALSYSAASCAEFTEGPVMPFIVGFLGIAFWFRVSRILEPALGRTKFVTVIARDGYEIMMHQIAGFMVLKGIFAVIYKLTPLCQDFDVHLMKTDVWYYYLPKGISNYLILYLAFGLAVPIVMEWGVRWCKGWLKK